ncbi:MAG: hypothetical protein DMG72_17010 [Acidobacteria bacterium]|nr:MAG: hypothetical protein DMG72_17010 [Acidobacteriota bacterium]
MKLQGDRARALATFDLVTKAMEKMFDRLPEENRIDFIDRIQTGKEQPSEQLEQVADVIREIQQKQRQQEQIAANLGRKGQEIVLPEKENYFHNRWKSKPGGGEDPEDDRITRLFQPRRPLEGSKRYNKQQYYSLKSGIEAGGKPYTTNPIRILRARIEDGMKFVTARRAWDEMGNLTYRKNKNPFHRLRWWDGLFDCRNGRHAN